MGKRVSGSLRKFLLDGTSCDVAADANLSESFAQFENEMLATSGKGMLKKTKKIQTVEGVVLVALLSKRITIQALADGIDVFPIIYEYANKDVVQCVGQINIESNETETNRVTITIQPEGVWTPFPA